MPVISFVVGDVPTRLEKIPPLHSCTTSAGRAKFVLKLTYDDHPAVRSTNAQLERALGSPSRARIWALLRKEHMPTPTIRATIPGQIDRYGSTCHYLSDPSKRTVWNIVFNTFGCGDTVDRVIPVML